MNSRADLLRTLAECERAFGDDPDRAVRLAALLGYERSSAAGEEAGPGDEPDGERQPAGQEETGSESPGVLYTAWRPASAWVVTQCDPVPTDECADVEPPLPLPDPDERPKRRRRFIPAPALRTPGHWQNLWDRVIIGHGHGHGRGRRVDLKRCLRDLSRARPVERLPLQPRHHFNGPITVIIDRPASLRQAHGDMLAAWHTLRALVGRQGLTGFQLRRGPEGRWERLDDKVSIASEQAVKPASQVLLLGAFGALERGLIRSDWRALITRLKARGHRIHLLPLCHLHEPPAPHTPLDPRQGREGVAGLDETVHLLLTVLASGWKISVEQLRYLRHALPGAGLQSELGAANHPAVIDRESHIDLDPERLIAYLGAFDGLPEETHRELEQAIGQWRETRNDRAHEMERLQAGQRLRWIPPGSFLMGSPEDEDGRFDSETLHEVELSQGYWLGETTCTRAFWQAVTGEKVLAGTHRQRAASPGTIV